jgi:hypothetical protein
VIAAKHTPGPWTQIGKSIGVESGEIATVWDFDGSPPTQLANARLIAASPELLHMLLTALPFVEDAQTDPCYKPGAVATVVRQMHAAIAKATGGAL